MSSINFHPAIQNVSIQISEKPYPWEANANHDVEIKLEFSLFGINKRILPISNTIPPFYIYIFLVYQNGGKDFEIISSVDFYCDEKLVEKDHLQFSARLILPFDKNFSEEDFVTNYYYINIAYSESSLEDGSDLNTLVGAFNHSLFHTKLNIGGEVESDG